jgi:hypothetical protein
VNTLVRWAKTTDHRVRAHDEHLGTLPVPRLDGYTCGLCDSEGTVAVRVKCTSCEAETWVGRFPEHRIV